MMRRGRIMKSPVFMGENIVTPSKRGSMMRHLRTVGMMRHLRTMKPHCSWEEQAKKVHDAA